MFLQSIKITEKNRRRTGEMKTEKRKKNNVIEHLCVDLLQSHKHLSQAISHNEFDFDAVQKSVLLLNNLLHFFLFHLKFSAFYSCFFFESSKQLLGWNRRESSVFGAITNESNVYHGDRQSILFHFMSKIDLAAISSVFDQQISECYLLGRKRSNKIIDKPSKNEYFIFTSIESAYTIWCAAWSSEKQRQTCVSLKGLSVFFLFLSKSK